MARIKSFCKNHIYAFTFFAFLVLYNFVVVLKCKLPVISGVVYSFHAVDYSMGFCSKLLPGAIFNFFYNEITEQRILFHETLLMLLFLGIVSVFCEKLFKRITEECRKTALIVILFFLSGPGTFAPFVKDIGSLDIYWVFSAAFLLFCLTNKYLYPLTIIPFVACVFVHFASFICYIPFFVVITFYKISTIEEKKERRHLWVCLMVSAVTAFVIAVYFVMFEKSNVTYTLEEFHSILESRGTTHFRYYDWTLYQISGLEIEEQVIKVEKSQGLKYGILLVIQQVQYTLKLFFQSPSRMKNVFEVLNLTLPFSITIVVSIIKQIKKEKCNKLKQLALAVLPLLFVAIPLMGLLFSLDYVRWFAHAFLILSSSFLFICYTEKQSLWSVIHRIIQKVPVLLLVCYYIIYAVNTYDLYS